MFKCFSYFSFCPGHIYPSGGKQALSHERLKQGGAGDSSNWGKSCIFWVPELFVFTKMKEKDSGFTDTRLKTNIFQADVFCLVFSWAVPWAFFSVATWALATTHSVSCKGQEIHSCTHGIDSPEDGTELFVTSHHSWSSTVCVLDLVPSQRDTVMALELMLVEYFILWLGTYSWAESSSFLRIRHLWISGSTNQYLWDPLSWEGNAISINSFFPVILINTLIPKYLPRHYQGTMLSTGYTWMSKTDKNLANPWGSHSSGEKQKMNM